MREKGFKSLQEAILSTLVSGASSKLEGAGGKMATDDRIETTHCKEENFLGVSESSRGLQLRRSISACMFLCLSSVASFVRADTTPYFMFSCIYQRSGNGNWTRIISDSDTQISLGRFDSNIFNPFTIGPKGAEFAGICSGLVPNGHGDPELFIQVVSGSGLDFAGAPTCLVTGGSVTAQSYLKPMMPPNDYISARRVFEQSIPFELFYVVGVRSAENSAQKRCQDIFQAEVGSQ
jgi:hypothetical protein